MEQRWITPRAEAFVYHWSFTRFIWWAFSARQMLHLHHVKYYLHWKYPVFATCLAANKRQIELETGDIQNIWLFVRFKLKKKKSANNFQIQPKLEIFSFLSFHSFSLCFPKTTNYKKTSKTSKKNKCTCPEKPDSCMCIEGYWCVCWQHVDTPTMSVYLSWGWEAEAALLHSQSVCVHEQSSSVHLLPSSTQPQTKAGSRHHGAPPRRVH